MAVQIQWRRDTAANWTSEDPILAEGEAGLEIDTYPPAWKIGNGVDAWSALSYQQADFDIAAEIHAATSKATPVDADELGLVDSAASNVLKKLTWTNLKATLKTYFDGLYTALVQTVSRFTLQTSVPSAASSGEAKLSVRDMAGLGILSLRSLSGHYLAFPDLTDPLVRGTWVSSGTNRAYKGNISGFSNTGSGSGTSYSGLQVVNLASSASTSSRAQLTNDNQSCVTSGGTYNGYFCWATVGFPDASYGSGATGVSIFVGVCSASNLATALTSDRILTSQRAAGFSFDTTLSDTNWQFTVRDGGTTNITTTDTGMAFAGAKHWLFMWYAPPGGSDTYWFIANITDGTSASGSTGRQHGSTGAGEVAGLVTRDNVARNVRVSDFWTRLPVSY